MSQAFGLSLDEYIYYGGYPGSMQQLKIDGPDRWLSYIRTDIVSNNLKKDILALIEIKRPMVMRELYRLGAKFSAQILNFNEISAQLQGGNQELISHYLEILDKVYMLKGLLNFSNRTLYRGGHVKFQVHNNALMSQANKSNFVQARADSTRWGRLVESAVGAHLINTIDTATRIYYWRFPAKIGERGRQSKVTYEVDFIVERYDDVFAIEVKSGKKRHSGERVGLNKFKEYHPKVSKCVLVGPGGDVELEEFLTKSAHDWCLEWSGDN